MGAMTRVVMLGIDGLDADLLRVYGPSLPHLRRLMLESPFLELTSSFPPETAPAWTSIYTGLNPANQGVVGSVQPREDGGRERETMPEPSSLRYRTFWDDAGKAGKRVCIVNPLCAYPAWPVNGMMLSQPPPGSDEYIVSTVPEDSLLSATFPPTLQSALVPRMRQLRDFWQMLYEATEQQAALGLELFKREPWDLFFLQLEALHHVQRFYWRYSDPGDPTYPGRSTHTNSILDFYRLFDQIIGRFRSYIGPESVLLVVSGHGLGRGSLYCLHLNEWLRTRGLLTPSVSVPRPLDRCFLLERIQSHLLELLERFHIQDRVSRHACSASWHPVNTDIDQQETVAQVVELAERSPFGGIVINREKAEHEGYNYEQLCTEMLHDLTQLRVHGQPVINWARTREDFYRDEYSERYPDILFELRSAYCIGGSLYRPLVTPNRAHRVVSGNSRMCGVLLLGNIPAGCTIHETGAEPVVMDVAPTIQSLLGTADAQRKRKQRYDGRALVSLAALPTPSHIPASPMPR